RCTQNDPTPVYSIRVPPGRQVLVVMDGHHRALSYLDGTGEARNVFVPVEVGTLEQVNAHFNRQTPDAPTNYPREVVELMLLDSMIPQGKIPRIVEEFPRRR